MGKYRDFDRFAEEYDSYECAIESAEQVENGRIKPVAIETAWDVSDHDAVRLDVRSGQWIGMRVQVNILVNTDSVTLRESIILPKRFNGMVSSVVIRAYIPFCDCYYPK